MSTQKKRTVYKYPYDFNMILKLLTYLTLRKYDHIYTNTLYSFRPGVCAKDAIMALCRSKDITKKYSYKIDVSDYFNSIPVEGICRALDDTVTDDGELLAFMKALLKEERVRSGEDMITEQKGIMAGTPIASFYANLYLKDLDEYFSGRGITYARYSDDIIVFADSEEELKTYKQTILDHLKSKGLKVNPDKEVTASPEEGFTFLGVEVKNGEIDIAPASVVKLKQKMRRKARALDRWHHRKGIDGTKAAAAFIRIFNHKLLEVNDDSDLTWSLWFFPVITTTKSQPCKRVLSAVTVIDVLPAAVFIPDKDPAPVSICVICIKTAEIIIAGSKIRNQHYGLNASVTRLISTDFIACIVYGIKSASVPVILEITLDNFDRTFYFFL